MAIAQVIQPLDTKHHVRAAFTSGGAALDTYLRDHAGQESRRNVARVYVLCEPPSLQVWGYYTLSSASLRLQQLAPDLAQRLPRYPTLPAILIGRLAVDQRRQGRGYGRLLVAHALRACLRAVDTVAAVAVVVDAKDERAAQFYAKLGFRSSADDRQRLYMMITDIRSP